MLHLKHLNNTLFDTHNICVYLFVFEGRGNKHGNKINKKAKLSSCHITHDFL